jgi:anti-sigma B factor antagonist
MAWKLLSLSDEIERLLPQTRQIVIDISGVEMIDAAGLGELVSVAVTAQASQGAIKLAAPSDLIRQLLELTHLISVFEVYPTLDSATLAFSGQAASPTGCTSPHCRATSHSADQSDRTEIRRLSSSIH